jgi:hypothetical protein
MKLGFTRERALTMPIAEANAWFSAYRELMSAKEGKGGGTAYKIRRKKPPK